MTRTTVRSIPRLAMIAIVLALLSLAAAWLLRPRQPTTMVATVTAPADLPGGVDAAIDLANERRVDTLVLSVRFLPPGVGSAAPCPESVGASADAIKHAGLPVTMLIEYADMQLMDCARAFAAATGQCIVSTQNPCFSPTSASRSRLGILLALLVAAALAALAWTLLRGARQPVTAPPPDPHPSERPGKVAVPRSPPPEPPPDPFHGPYPNLAHPLAGHLRYPQPAEVRSLLEPTGYVAFEGGLWRAAWADPSMPPPGIGARVLIQYDERTARLVAASGR
jgi:hypothetical protein